MKRRVVLESIIYVVILASFLIYRFSDTKESWMEMKDIFSSGIFFSLIFLPAFILGLFDLYRNIMAPEILTRYEDKFIYLRKIFLGNLKYICRFVLILNMMELFIYATIEGSGIFAREILVTIITSMIFQTIGWCLIAMVCLCIEILLRNIPLAVITSYILLYIITHYELEEGKISKLLLPIKNFMYSNLEEVLRGYKLYAYNSLIYVFLGVCVWGICYLIFTKLDFLEKGEKE